MSNKGFDSSLTSKYRQELFGLSILSIMLFHFTEINMKYGGDPKGLALVLINGYYRYIGSIGVELFLFLSGVGLYHALSNNRDINRFYRRRYSRILIPYAIVGGIYWLLFDLHFTDQGIVRFIKDFSFYTFVTEGVNNFWFIFLMAGLYLLFPLLYKMLLDKRYEYLWFVLILAAVIAIPIIAADMFPELYDNIGIALTRVPIFIIGTYAGKRIKEGKRIPHAVALAIILCGFCVKYYALTHGVKGYLGRYATGIFAAMGWPMFMATRYFTMIGIAILLAPVLSRLTIAIGKETP